MQTDEVWTSGIANVCRYNDIWAWANILWQFSESTKLGNTDMIWTRLLYGYIILHN